MNSSFNPDKKVVVRGPELALDMSFNAVSTLLTQQATIVVDGKALVQADLLKQIDAMRTPLKDVHTAKDALKKSRAVLRDKLPEIDKYIRALRTGLRAYLGENNPDIEKFGFKMIGAKRQRSAEEKALSAEKARRTREARHTMGPKQKEAIKAESPSSITIPRTAETPTGAGEAPPS